MWPFEFRGTTYLQFIQLLTLFLEFQDEELFEMPLQNSYANKLAFLDLVHQATQYETDDSPFEFPFNMNYGDILTMINLIDSSKILHYSAFIRNFPDWEGDNLTPNDFYETLSTRPMHFYYLTGETFNSFMEIVQDIKHDVMQRYKRYKDFRRAGNRNRRRKTKLNVTNMILLTIIWLRRYPTMQHLASKFGIGCKMAWRIVHVTVPILHVQYRDEVEYIRFEMMYILPCFSK